MIDGYKKPLTVSVCVITICLCVAGCREIINIPTEEKVTETMIEKEEVKDIAEPEYEISDNVGSQYDLLMDIKTEGNVDSLVVERVAFELAKLPESIQQAFMDDGWTLCVTDRDLDAEYFGGRYGRVMGTSVYPERTIYISNYESAALNSTIHEIGHWLDWHYGFGTDSEEFSKIYERENQTFIDEYNSGCVFDTKELFAEGFYRYFIDSEYLGRTVPELHEFIENCIKNL